VSEAAMASGMHIRVKWCDAAASAASSVGKAEWTLFINEQVATELEDLTTEAVRSHVVAPMELLGEWLAHNWWRLRWEPEQQQPDADWKMSHSLPAIGGGVAWPNLTFSSDGDYIQCRCYPTGRLPDTGMPVRYLSRFDEVITSDEFEVSVDSFMEDLVGRLRASNYRNDIALLWSQVLDERRNAESATWRRLEALLGYDPDEGPDELLSFLIKRFDQLGREAVNEIAAEGRSRTMHVLERLENIAASGTMGGLPPGEEYLRGVLRDIPTCQPVWRRAAEAANIARRHWGLGSGPISDPQLLELFELPNTMFEENQVLNSSGFPVALRTERGIKVALTKKRITGKRFALARMLADELYAPAEDKLLPITDSKTARQRFQRAFAQEFLCPFSSLEEELGERVVNEEFIEDMAEHYRVSPQTVSYLLQNRGVWHAA
jgi:hypothetical protein